MPKKSAIGRKNTKAARKRTDVAVFLSNKAAKKRKAETSQPESVLPVMENFFGPPATKKSYADLTESSAYQSHSFLTSAHAGPSNASVVQQEGFFSIQRSHTFTNGSVQLAASRHLPHALQSIQVDSACSSTMMDTEVRMDLSQSINPTFRIKPPSKPETLRLRSKTPTLPHFTWSKPEGVWNLMCWKETVYSRDPHLFQRHPDVQPRMRAILFDWLTEVCEVHNLHRETYYLSVDFVDRFLSKQHNIPKSKLQLVGVSALFVAAKLEEIYPPKLSDFAYVTDGACTENDILDMEMILIKTLNWSLSPVTVIHWLSTYLQLSACSSGSKSHSPDFEHQCRRNLFGQEPSGRLVLPRFHRYMFLQLCQLIDLCMMDSGCLQFPYSIIAASAIFSILEPSQTALSLSGFKWQEIAPCVQWIVPFVRAVREQPEVQTKSLPEVAPDDQHNIQSHAFDLQLLDRAQLFQQEMLSQRTSPVFANRPSLLDIFPTPPQSDERPSATSSRFPSGFLTPQ